MPCNVPVSGKANRVENQFVGGDTVTCKSYCKRQLCYITLRKRLRTHKVFTKDHCFYLNCHKFSIRSYVLDVYKNRFGEAILIHIHNI